MEVNYTNLRKALKIPLLFILGFIFLNTFIISGYYIYFRSKSYVSATLWRYGYIPLIIFFFYSIYFSINSFMRYSRLKENLLRQGKSTRYLYIWVPIMVVTVPAFLLFTLNFCIVLAGYYFANQPFSEWVIVKESKCELRIISHGPSQFTLIINDSNSQRHVIYFPVKMCRDDPYMSQLSGQRINLYGRKWYFGSVYDGFYYGSSGRTPKTA